MYTVLVCCKDNINSLLYRIEKKGFRLDRVPVHIEMVCMKILYYMYIYSKNVYRNIFCIIFTRIPFLYEHNAFIYNYLVKCCIFMSNIVSLCWRLYLYIEDCISVLKIVSLCWRLYLYVEDFISILKIVSLCWRLYV